MKKATYYLVAVMIMFAFIACDKENRYEGDLMSYSNTIYNVKTISQLTGSDALVDTKNKWKVGGTDLGFPIYNSVTNEMHLAFGDTFLNNADMTGGWRSNVLAQSNDFDLSDGLTINDFYKGPTGAAKAIIEGHHDEAPSKEVTKIPTGGIEVNGIMYVFYMSVRQWTTPGEWHINYNGVIKSTDNCMSWQRIYDLTWINNLEGQVAIDTLILANEDVNLIKNSGNISLKDRIAPNFMQIYPIDGKDDYIYIFGLSEGRSGGVKLGRVKKTNFESFDDYEYFTGDSSQPIFEKGNIGLNKLLNLDDHMIIQPFASEPSVMYNKYLKKWMITYLMGSNIIYRVSDNLWGEWSNPEIIITSNEYSGLYGGHIHEKYTKKEGKIFYIIISQWKPVYNTFLLEVTLE